jgi:hypothetical protein
MLRLVSPVDRFEARQLYADCVREGLVKPRLGQLIARQLAEAAVMGFESEGRLVALMTATPTDLAVAGLPTLEISVCGRRAECGPLMVSLVRLARLTLAAWLQDGTVALCGVVKAGHRPGGKLARLAGFTLARTERGLELWTRCPHVGSDQAALR